MNKKYYIFRKNFLWSCLSSLIFTTLFIIFLWSVIIGAIDNVKDAFLSVGGILILDIFMTWSIARNKYQYIRISKEGVAVGSFLGEIKHMYWKEIEQIYVNTFLNLPKVKMGQRLKGIDSNSPMPKCIPNKWIVFDDGKCQKNLKNIYSYLVPIREHMLIKIKFSDEIINHIKQFYRNSIVEITTQEHSYTD